jgi:hypothetical protein
VLSQHTTHGIIGVTDKIRRYELDRTGCKLPSLVLQNGISLEEIPFKPPSVFNGKSLQLAFASSQFAPWHGLDRLHFFTSSRFALEQNFEFCKRFPRL